LNLRIRHSRAKLSIYDRAARHIFVLDLMAHIGEKPSPLKSLASFRHTSRTLMRFASHIAANRGTTAVRSYRPGAWMLAGVCTANATASLTMDALPSQSERHPTRLKPE
jgi:hypothetical protein